MADPVFDPEASAPDTNVLINTLITKVHTTRILAILLALVVGVVLILAPLGYNAYQAQGRQLSHLAQTNDRQAKSLKDVSSALKARNTAVRDLSHDNTVIACKNSTFGTWADDLKAVLVAPRDSPEQAAAFSTFKALPSLADLYALCNKL